MFASLASRMILMTIIWTSCNGLAQSLSIPTVDLSQSDSASARILFDAASEYGFFKIINHGISSDTLQQVLENTKAFFNNLDLDEKLKLTLNDTHWGYLPFQAEKVDKEKQTEGDLKEAFAMINNIEKLTTLDTEKQHDGQKMIKNQWPKESSLPGFKTVMSDYMIELDVVSEKIAKLIALSLNLSSDHFQQPGIRDLTNDLLVPIYYPQNVTHDAEAGLYGIGEHSDYDLWTILLTDNTPGLQILYENEWVNVDHQENAFIVNIADSMQKWTNDMFKSMKHRVIMDGTKDRYSVGYFVAANFDTIIDCLPNTVILNDEKYGKCNHEPYKAGEYFDYKVAATVDCYEGKKDHNKDLAQSLSIPSIDLSQLGPESAKILFDAASEYGFFKIINHGVSSEITQQVLEYTKAFYNLDLDEKLKLLYNDTHWGYLPFKGEKPGGDTQSEGDLKEGYMIINNINKPTESDADKQEAGQNIVKNKWPEESVIPGFRKVMSDYMLEMDVVSDQIAQLVALSLNLSSDYFMRPGIRDRAYEQLFPIYYPKNETHDPDAGLYGVGEHSDYDLWTILLTDDTPGLQILYENEWVTVEPQKDAFIVNIADSMQKWTNDIFKSVKHRVIMDGTKDRYSVPYFTRANWNVIIDCLPNTVIPNHAKYGKCNHKPYKSGEYFEYKIATTVDGFIDENENEQIHKEL